MLPLGATVMEENLVLFFFYMNKGPVSIVVTVKGQINVRSSTLPGQKQQKKRHHVQGCA